jgi:hypothetical protein
MTSGEGRSGGGISGFGVAKEEETPLGGTGGAAGPGTRAGEGQPSGEGSGSGSDVSSGTPPDTPVRGGKGWRLPCCIDTIRHLPYSRADFVENRACTASRKSMTPSLQA